MSPQGRHTRGSAYRRLLPGGRSPVRRVHIANVVSSLLCITLLLPSEMFSDTPQSSGLVRASTGACVHEQTSRNWSAEFADNVAHPQSEGFWTGVRLLTQDCDGAAVLTLGRWGCVATQPPRLAVGLVRWSPPQPMPRMRKTKCKGVVFEGTRNSLWGRAPQESSPATPICIRFTRTIV